ncbi:ABC transporter ATP-binding protein [Aerococcaceae bacterium WGS1372]
MLKMLKRFTKTEGLLIGLSLIFIVIQVWLDLKIPDYMSEVKMLVQTPGSEMRDIYVAGGLMLACAFGSLVSAVAVAVIASKISANLGANLRSAMFNKVMDFSMEEMSRFSTDSLITRSTNDITQVQMLIVMGLQAIIKAPIIGVWAILKIADKSWQWTFTTAMAIVILMAVVGILMFLALPKFKSLQALTDRLSSVTRENLSGLRVVRAYNAEDYQEDKFEAVNTELTNTHLFTSRAMAFMQPSIQLVMSGLSLAIYWIGAILIEQATMPMKLTLFSDMIVFSSYAMQIVMAFMMLIMIFILVPRASVSINRIQEVLETDLAITDGGMSASSRAEVGQVEFKNVSFKYPGAQEYVIRDVSFKANQGETVAFIGATGSGKSTLINLIPRLYEATEGEVLVNGMNVKDYNLDALHNTMGYVSQKAQLFNGTIKSNVAYGNNGHDGFIDSDIIEAIYTAQASDFVEALEGGYDAKVTPGGTNLSGGQKQRISIARAIARQAKILIFDDSFSALDYRTDKKLRQALREDCADATKLIVAQRIGTIKDADRIIVLDEGRVVGNGTHDELMANCLEYQEIAYSQLSKEELA